jgi:hypothetical protein
MPTSVPDYLIFTPVTRTPTVTIRNRKALFLDSDGELKTVDTRGVVEPLGGDDGGDFSLEVGTTTTGEAGTNASVINAGSAEAPILNFTIPRGEDGESGSPGTDGTDGAAATIAVGTVTTGAAGSSATVTNVGTSAAAVFDFSIPQGATGPAGADTPDTPPSSPSIYDDEFPGSSLSGSWTQALLTTTATVANGCLILTPPNVASPSLPGIYKAAPAAPFTVTSRALTYGTNSGSNEGSGVLLRSTAGRFLVIWNDGAGRLLVARFTNQTTISTVPFNMALSAPKDALIRFRVESGNINAEWSVGGEYWFTIYTETTASFMTDISHFGLHLWHNTATTQRSVFKWFRVTL